MRWLILALTVTLLASNPTRAWHAAGHSATGAIAYHEIRSDQVLVDRGQRTLLGNSDFAQRVAANLHQSNVTPAEYYFMRAATWPDEVRKTHFDVPSAHYINLPFTPPGTGSGHLKAEPTDILKALRQHRETLRTSHDPQARGIALAWIFHLVGDIHQPLHSIALVNGAFSEGDRGGNAISIKTIPGYEDQDNLHSLWDGYWDGLWGKPQYNTSKGYYERAEYAPSRRFPAVHKLALNLIQRYPSPAGLSLAAGPSAWPHWAKESYDAATTYVYRYQGTLLPVGAGAPPVDLTAGYRATALQKAEPRLAVAGYRLAATLRSLKPLLTQ